MFSAPNTPRQGNQVLIRKLNFIAASECWKIDTSFQRQSNRQHPPKASRNVTPESRDVRCRQQLKGWSKQCSWTRLNWSLNSQILPPRPQPVSLQLEPSPNPNAVVTRWWRFQQTPREAIHPGVQPGQVGRRSDVTAPSINSFCNGEQRERKHTSVHKRGDSGC